MDRLEEIKLRDTNFDPEKGMPTIWIQHFAACSDRRWLLAEVERLRAQVAELEGYIDEHNRYVLSKDP